MVMRKGTTVSWKWGNGRAEGTIVEVHHEDVTRTTNGATVTRHGSSDEPAYVIEQDDGTTVVKLAGEVERVD